MKRQGLYRYRIVLRLLLACSLLLAQPLYAQDAKKTRFSIRDNRLFITVAKDLKAAALDSFIQAYNLRGIGLHTLLRNGITDSLTKAGWRPEPATTGSYTFSKDFSTTADLQQPADRIVFSSVPTSSDWRMIGGNRVEFGVNKFRNGTSFRIENGVVQFVLKGFTKARSVKLAGNFTNWQNAAFPLTKTADGWTVPVRLKAGKYYYKFIVDGNWIIDPANQQVENDGMGNDNSVFVVPNKVLALKGYLTAHSATLTGSFMNWSKEGLPMEKKEDGWYIGLYLPQGTHHYSFLVDGVVINEDGQRADNGPQKTSLGAASTFVLPGYKKARRVAVAGDFNDWKPEEIWMQPTNDGWKTNYVLGPGNYQYKFIVDGAWITDPANPNVVSDGEGNLNSFRVVAPNYTFRLKGYPSAKRVYLAGSFNNWSEQGFTLTQEGNEWVGQLYLGKGKHLYKFIVDGRWMRDPANPLWEDGDENSVLWKE